MCWNTWLYNQTLDWLHLYIVLDYIDNICRMLEVINGSGLHKNMYES